MAIIVTYDDSDGWYDHVMPPIVHQSNDPAVDSICGTVPLPAGAFNDRCGYGQRLPFIVMSPYAKRNYVDHATIDTTSVLRFIEDNWQLGRIDSLDSPGGAPPGQASFDQLAGSIEGLFDFDDRYRDSRDDLPLLLNDSTGEVVSPQRGVDSAIRSFILLAFLGVAKEVSMAAPIPPFTRETAIVKVRMAEDGWNSRDPHRVSLAYTEDSRWRNRAEFITGHAEIVAFLTRKWNRELDYRLIKELWTFADNRIAVRFAYEWHDDSGNWFRSYGNENWDFDAAGVMRQRLASINDLPINEADRKYHWPLGRRPDDHPGLSDLGL